MTKPSKWTELIAANPQHSHDYAERFRRLAADGQDIFGEARLVDAMLPRGSRILDAGCGGGRTGGHLARVGHTVVGVDQDPVLIEAAETDHPGPTWLVGDLSELDLPARGIADPFDVIVCAGNVVTFLHPDTRRETLRRFADHLAADGRVIIGFGTARGYAVTDFVTDLESVGLIVDLALSTWDLRPYDADSDFLVAILRHRRASDSPAE